MSNGQFMGKQGLIEFVPILWADVMREAKTDINGVLPDESRRSGLVKKVAPGQIE